MSEARGEGLEAVDAVELRRRTLSWVEGVVLELELCPFARAPIEAGRLRIAVSATTQPLELLAALDDELDRLQGADAEVLETTLLVHPRCLLEFERYNDFLGEVDALLEARALDGVVQVASFHPDYCFVDAPAEDPANYSNRAPFPMLHLLREASVSRVVDAHPDIASVPRRNVERLRSMSEAALARLLEH